MAELFDRVKETTTTTGTVTIALGGAVIDFRSFNSSITNGTTVRYGIDDYAGNWELGDGVVGTGTLTRSPIKSSNGNALVNFGVGTKYVYVTAIAADYLPNQTSNSGKILSTDGTNPSWIPNTVGTVTSVTGTAPVVSSGGTTPAISMAAATSAVNGYLTSTDWTTFNSKGSGTVTAVSVTSANGFSGTSSGGATPALTISTSVTGVLKGNGTTVSAATSGTDYSAGTSSLATGILKSTTTSGALSIAVAADFPTLNQNTTGTASNITAYTVNQNVGTANTVQHSDITTARAASLTTGYVYYGNTGTKYAGFDGTNFVTSMPMSFNILGSSASCTGNAATVTTVTATNLAGAVAPSTTGNVLTSNGTSWVSSAPSGGGSLLRQTVFTASGTWTKGAGTTKILAQGVGGGGGGGGGLYFSSGAGAGGYASKFVNVTSISTVSVTIGSGGAGGSGANGTNGGTTSFGLHFTCNGGMGGQYDYAYPSLKGGLGGSAFGGDVNISGGCGGSGVKGTSSYFNYSTGGIGASSFYGGGGAAAQYDGVAENGYAAGSGGGGTGYNSGGVYTGGTGANGIVIILEFA